MILRFTKAEPASRHDRLVVTDAQGVSRTCDMPRQGVLPRLAVAFVAAHGLGVDAVFMRRVCREQGNIPAQPDEEAWFDALVECLESEQWGGASAFPLFSERLRKTARQYRVEPPAISPEQLDALRLALREFGARWRPLGAGASLEYVVSP